MTLNAADVAEFLAAEKTVPADARWSWRTRNRHNRRCHLKVEAGGVTVGELILVVNLAIARHWTFSLLRRRAEVLRWDFARAPYKHRNPRACGEDLRGTVRDLEHEHLWRPGTEMRCVTGLSDMEGLNHRQALEAFADRANIILLTAYQPPPAEGEQLTIE
jgi:hypothetical protein